MGGKGYKVEVEPGISILNNQPARQLLSHCHQL